VNFLLDNPRRESKTLIDRAKNIFELLEAQNDVIYKSDLKKVGIDSTSAERWIALIQYIQSQPELEVIQAGRYKTIKLQTK
jgi:hypothetical protein